MKFKVFTTEEFDRRYGKLDREIQRQIAREIDQLEENPFVGKPLGYSFFREKKVQGYRVYYLIYEEYVVVFVVTLSEKKDQKNTITTIKNLIPYYREEIRKRIISGSSKV